MGASTLATKQSSAGAPSIDGDWRWLSIMAMLTLAEFAGWSVSVAPWPWLITYLAVAYVGLATAHLLRRTLSRRSDHAPWIAVIIGTTLAGIGASLFLPLKFAIPQKIPFWMDASLAQAERAVFGAHPWQILELHFGWATAPLDRIYGLWLPVQLLVLFVVMLGPPSRAKSRALIAYSLAWTLLGVVAATFFSSAGPIFYDRLLGSNEFLLLGETLRSRGAIMTLFETNMMWAALANGKPGLVSGISAFPSIHVAISLWIFLAARTLAPRTAKLALIYFFLISIGSVQLGWHYVSDGLGGAIGMLAVWRLTKFIEGSRLFEAKVFRRIDQRMRMSFGRRYLDLLGSIYIYNEHRGYTAIDRVLIAVRTRWPDDIDLITKIEKHRADEQKHYLMFRRWFERRGVMPYAVDSTCGHIDRFVGIMFRSTIDDLDSELIVNRTDLFERMCRVISLTEKRGHRQVEILLRHPIVRSDRGLMKIFTIVEKDEPSHWAPYDDWLIAHGKRTTSWWERTIDSFIHSELLFLKLPVLFLRRGLSRLAKWADDDGAGEAAAERKARSSEPGLANGPLRCLMNRKDPDPNDPKRCLSD